MRIAFLAQFYLDQLSAKQHTNNSWLNLCRKKCSNASFHSDNCLGTYFCVQMHHFLGYVNFYRKFMLYKLHCITNASLAECTISFCPSALIPELEVMWYARHSTQSSWCPRQHRFLSKCTGSYVAREACKAPLNTLCKACWKDIQSVGAVAMGCKSMTWRNWKDWSRLYWDGRRCDFCVSYWTRHILLVAST